MTLTKADIVQNIHAELGFPKKISSELVETMLELIKQSMGSGEDVLISGFGKFSVNRKNERKGRNPATGDSMALKARRIVTFRCSRTLRDKINNGS